MFRSLRATDPAVDRGAAIARGRRGGKLSTSGRSPSGRTTLPVMREPGDPDQVPETMLLFPGRANRGAYRPLLGETSDRAAATPSAAWAGAGLNRGGGEGAGI